MERRLRLAAAAAKAAEEAADKAWADGVTGADGAVASTAPTESNGAAPAQAGAVDVSTWRALPVELDERVLAAVARLGFAAPTPIQAAALPLALGDSPRDLIGGARSPRGPKLTCQPWCFVCAGVVIWGSGGSTGAETGSGKTLAFGIPIMQVSRWPHGLFAALRAGWSNPFSIASH